MRSFKGPAIATTAISTTTTTTTTTTTISTTAATVRVSMSDTLATATTATHRRTDAHNNALLDLEHMPLLDYISYADLQAVRDTLDTNLFGAAGLDEFGNVRVPIAFAIESALLNYEHNFSDRVQIAVEMTRRYGPMRPFLDPLCGREDTVLRRAFRQVTVYPSHTPPPPSSSVQVHAREYDNEEDEHEELEEEPNQGSPAAATVEEEEDGLYTSDIPLVLKLVTALIREAGASAMEPNVVESAVHHGLHELLPLLFQEGALFQPRGMLCLHLLLRDTSLCDARIAATLRRLLQYKAVERRRLSMHSVQRRSHNTPLHAAARSGRGGRVMRLLLRMGANLFQTNLDGHTALDLVRQFISNCAALRPEPVQPPQHSGCSCTACALRAERRTTHRLVRALSAQKALERAEMLREAELACMMATHGRLGAGSLLRWVDPFMLRDLIVRPACAV